LNEKVNKVYFKSDLSLDNVQSIKLVTPQMSDNRISWTSIHYTHSNL